jgi:SAM-dependent methyltransferase
MRNWWHVKLCLVCEKNFSILNAGTVVVYSRSIFYLIKAKYLIHRRRAGDNLERPTFEGKILRGIFGQPDIPGWLEKTGVQQDEKILDVGTGSGELLFQLGRLGYSRLFGIDPFAECDVDYGFYGIEIRRAEIDQHRGRYDLVMFHHSYEHIADPLSALREAARLTKPGKLVLIRIPIAGSYAWRKYGMNWIQFDAPRHIFLHTESSIRILAEKSGLALEKVEYDSTAFQFWGSEQCSKNIPLFSEGSYAVNPRVFSTDEIRMWEKKSVELNLLREGDQACFYLRRPS